MSEEFTLVDRKYEVIRQMNMVLDLNIFDLLPVTVPYASP